MRAAIAYITLAFFVTSCAGGLVAATPLAPTSLPSPTSAQTLPPTSTPEPTLEIPTAEATVDLTAPDAFVCAVRSQAIRNGTKFSSKDRFNLQDDSLVFHKLHDRNRGFCDRVTWVLWLQISGIHHTFPFFT